jgi:hypothetical protein
MFCGKCGKPIHPADGFCRSCGAPAREPPVVAATPAPQPRTARASPARYIAIGGAILFGLIVLSILGVFNSSHEPQRSKSDASATSVVPSEHKPQMTPQEARAAQKAMLDTAEVYRNTIAFTGQVDAGNIAGICASISQVETSARHALSSLGKVPVSPATQPMIQALRPG